MKNRKSCLALLNVLWYRASKRSLQIQYDSPFLQWRSLLKYHWFFLYYWWYDVSAALSWVKEMCNSTLLTILSLNLSSFFSLPMIYFQQVFEIYKMHLFYSLISNFICRTVVRIAYFLSKQQLPGQALMKLFVFIVRPSIPRARFLIFFLNLL